MEMVLIRTCVVLWSLSQCSGAMTLAFHQAMLAQGGWLKYRDCPLHCPFYTLAHSAVPPVAQCAAVSSSVDLCRCACSGRSAVFHPMATVTGRDDLRKALIAESLDDIVAAQALECAESAVNQWEMKVTKFYRPTEVAAVQHVLSKMADLKITAYGGYPQAERQRVFFSRALEYPDPEQERKYREGYLQVVALEGNFIFDKASHRDFLGAILNTGITREMVGDILIQGERGAHIIVTPEISEFLLTGLRSVRSVPVQCRQIPLSELGVRPPAKKDVQSIEASMRLDAIASAGMSMSRGKVKGLVESGNVFVNWREVKSANKEVKEGDLITVRGKGRLEVQSVEKTSKDRFRVKMTKYV